MLRPVHVACLEIQLASSVHGHFLLRCASAPRGLGLLVARLGSVQLPHLHVLLALEAVEQVLGETLVKVELEACEHLGEHVGRSRVGRAVPLGELLENLLDIGCAWEGDELLFPRDVFPVVDELRLERLGQDEAQIRLALVVVRLGGVAAPLRPTPAARRAWASGAAALVARICLGSRGGVLCVRRRDGRRCGRFGLVRIDEGLLPREILVRVLEQARVGHPLVPCLFPALVVHQVVRPHGAMLILCALPVFGHQDLGLVHERPVEAQHLFLRLVLHRGARTWAACAASAATRSSATWPWRDGRARLACVEDTLAGRTMEHWKQWTASVGPLGQKLTERFGTLNQQARERFGHAQDLTELPAEYKQLEQRVDALKSAHQHMVRTIKTYESEAYDYPHALQESVTHGAQHLGHTLSTWAAQATKSAAPAPAASASHPRTLSHAIARSATAAAMDLSQCPPKVPAYAEGELVDTTESKLAELLRRFAVAQDAVGHARLHQDQSIVYSFLVVWNTFGAQIQMALRARQQVRDARLHLDGWRAHLKSAEQSSTPSSSKLASLREEVEQAEDKLVSATEEAISLMKTVLDNPEPIKSLAQLVQAQLAYHRSAAATLEQLSADMSDVVTSVETDFRASRE